MVTPVSAGMAYQALRQFDETLPQFTKRANAVREAVDSSWPALDHKNDATRVGYVRRDALERDYRDLFNTSRWLLGDTWDTPSPIIDAVFGARRHSEHAGPLTSWIQGRTSRANMYNYVSPYSDAEAGRALDKLVHAVEAQRPELVWQRYLAHAPIPVPAIQRGASGVRVDLLPRAGVDPTDLRRSIEALADASDEVAEARRSLERLVGERYRHDNNLNSGYYTVTYRDRPALERAFDALQAALRSRHGAQQAVYDAGGSTRPDDAFHVAELEQLTALKDRIDVPKGLFSREHRFDGSRTYEKMRWAVDTTPDERLATEARALTTHRGRSAAD